MESITEHAFGGESTRQSEGLGNRRLTPVKRCVEAGYLGDLERPLADRLNGSQVVWLVKWRQWNKCFQRLKHLGIHKHRMSKFLAPVSHAVAGGDDTMLTQLAAAPAEYIVDGARVPELTSRWPIMHADDISGHISGHEVRLSEQALDLAAQQRLGRIAVEKDSKFQTRRTSV
jgi:hypothetical protein